MINIGTNFEYQGELFLDDRQGKPLTTEDLRTWSIPIPEGFEVCLNKVWYIYDSNYNDPEADLSKNTGHFRRRIDYEYSGSIIESWIQYILTLIRDVPPVNPLAISLRAIPGDTLQEVNGPTINLSLGWTLTKGGQTVTPTNATVNGSSSGVSANFSSFGPIQVPALSSAGSRSYTVKAWYNNESVSKTHTISYKYRKYWGTSANLSITTNEVTSSFSRGWADDWKLSDTIFDCTGGKYPYYVIPTSLYNSSQNEFTMWVNGLVMSDYTTSTLTINGIQYTAIRHSIIQTGKLRIAFRL